MVRLTRPKMAKVAPGQKLQKKPAENRRYDIGGKNTVVSPPPRHPNGKNEPLVQVFNRVSDRVQDFRLLPGLPSIREISQLSGNVNQKIRYVECRNASGIWIFSIKLEKCTT